MKLSLKPKTGKLIEDSMKSGGYATPEEAVVAGLIALKHEQELGVFERGEMDELLAEGERSGEPLDGEKVLRELRRLRKRPRSKAG